jgi:hypothetical protein
MTALKQLSHVRKQLRRRHAACGGSVCLTSSGDPLALPSPKAGSTAGVSSRSGVFRCPRRAGASLEVHDEIHGRRLRGRRGCWCRFMGVQIIRHHFGDLLLRKSVRGSVGDRRCDAGGFGCDGSGEGGAMAFGSSSFDRRAASRSAVRPSAPVSGSTGPRLPMATAWLSIAAVQEVAGGDASHRGLIGVFGNFCQGPDCDDAVLASERDNFL